MNRFVTNLSPIISAQDQCDKHLRKMITEEGQMLSVVIRTLMPDTYGESETLMRLGLNHDKHPAYLWLLDSYMNFQWAMSHWLAMGTEYRYRFDKTHGTEHRLADVFAEFCEPERYKLWARVEHTPHPQCFGAWTHKTKEDWPVTAYRSYMRDYKQHQMEMKWTRRHKPSWF